MAKKTTESLSDQLRVFINQVETLTELADASGVDVGALSRFMRGQRSLTMDSVDAIGRSLGLKLVRAVARASRGR